MEMRVAARLPHHLRHSSTAGMTAEAVAAITVVVAAVEITSRRISVRMEAPPERWSRYGRTAGWASSLGILQGMRSSWRKMWCSTGPTLSKLRKSPNTKNTSLLTKYNFLQRQPNVRKNERTGLFTGLCEIGIAIMRVELLLKLQGKWKHKNLGQYFAQNTTSIKRDKKVPFIGMWKYKQTVTIT